MKTQHNRTWYVCSLYDHTSSPSLNNSFTIQNHDKQNVIMQRKFAPLLHVVVPEQKQGSTSP